MSEQELGKLERVDLRATWPSEDGDFTPWLAQEENLAILGETLGIELELEAQEKSVGPFRADILCKDDSGNWVLIENQLERTDHTHLGQLLTYASGLEAVTIIWIAKQFTEEHRSTLDWLNRITDEKFHFFGVEVELWRIGNSPSAPKFNMVCKPNDWSRSVAQAARGLNDTQVMQLEYWTAFSDVLRNTSDRFSGVRTPQPATWMGYSIGKSNFKLSVAMVHTQRKLYTELYIGGGNAKPFFYLLRKQKQSIEQELGIDQELGEVLEWEEKPGQIISRIRIYWKDVNPEDKEDWPRQHKWLAERLNDMHRVFYDRVQALNPDDWQEEQES